MRGIPSLITDIRKKVFTEVARMAYEGGDYTKAEDLPYVIVPGDKALHRESIFLERAIVEERVRLALGLNIRYAGETTPVSEDLQWAEKSKKHFENPLVNIIPYACHACPTKQYKVTQFCQNCLAASCEKVCPKGTISFVNGKSQINPDACIKCGKCVSACPMGLEPYLISKMSRKKLWDAAEDHNVTDCIECGCCSYSCPANIPLLDYIRLGKQTVMGIIRARAAKK